MKISSQQVGSGKLGNAVYAQTGGECIARQYQPNVANPSSEGQVEQRSKFKLMSQLSAALKPSLAIRKEGLKSARNIFTSINAPLATIDDGMASINLNKVQITKSNRGMSDFTADRSSATKIAVALVENMANNLNRVVYAAFTKEVDGSLTAFASVAVDAAGVNGQFPGELPYTTKAVVIYAYGMQETNAKASAAYSNMTVPTAEQVAKLLASSSEVAAGTNLTATKGLTMLVSETSGSSDAEEHFLVSVSASGNGSVSGGGSFVAGQMATLRATPDAEASFVAWKKNSASGEVLSTSETYTFEVTRSVVIVGVFQGGPTPTYNIALSANPAAGGSVSGGGSKAEGSQCVAMATPNDGYTFTGWYENGAQVSSNSMYSFTVERARTLEARFAESSGVTIAVSTNMASRTTVSGGGTYNVGDSVTVETSANQGTDLTFEGWFEGSTKVSSNETYTFTAERSMTLEAQWLDES